jgi:hypothetical protein
MRICETNRIGFGGFFDVTPSVCGGCGGRFKKLNPVRLGKPNRFGRGYYGSKSGFILGALVCLAPIVSAQGLPSYEDFRRVDRARRATGQLQTAELMQVTQVDRGLIQRTALQAANDFPVVWGAAELINSWPFKRELFDKALAASGSNVMVALRYACVAAQQRDEDVALPLLHFVEKKDEGNAVPWLVELRLLQLQQKGVAELKLPASGTAHYRDYAGEAARARIRLLEAAGYSPYAARRLGFAPDTIAVGMARELTEQPIEKAAAPFLLGVARAMQERPMYLLTELVGETLERAATAAGVEGQTGAEVSMRNVELDSRREEIKALVTAVERNAVEVATETEMVQYFNDVLNLGEEVAMRRLAGKVGGKPVP